LNYFTGFLAVETSAMKSWAAMLWGFAAIYANLMFFINNFRHIQNKAEYWWARALAFVIAVIFIVVGLAYGQASELYTWLMNYTLVPASNASWLTAFFIFAFSYHRYTHARDLSSMFLVVGLILSNLGQIPMFAANPSISALGQWLYSYPGNGVMRAMYMSVAVGMLITIVRTFLGLQRSLAEKRFVGG
jgi:hypothetical protein